MAEKVCNEIVLRVTIRMIMDHRNAVASKASERYLLGEMSEPERFAFEAHYFDCLECATDVRAGASLRRQERRRAACQSMWSRMKVWMKK